MRKVLTFAGVIALISLLATCITTDTTNPVVSIISPVNNDTITTGNILIKVYATDNKEVTKVEFYIDNNLKGTDQAGNADTFRYTWDASAETPGSTHSIYAKAYDGAGNTATSTSITIVIAGGGGGTGPTHHSGTITQNETWYPSGNPHIIDCDVSIENNATLTIKPGCIVKFEPETELYAGYHLAGAIIANGTQDSTILFTSNVATPAPGDWQNVGLYDLAMSTSSFCYCIFEYGGSSSGWPGEFYAEGITSVKIANCTFRYSGNYGVYLDDDAGFNTFTNNSITACAQFPLRIHAEYARTVGSGNSLSGNTQNGILIKGGNVQTSGTWINHNVPYVIEGNVDVGSNTSNPVLTIAQGQRFNSSRMLSFTADTADGVQSKPTALEKESGLSARLLRQAGVIGNRSGFTNTPSTPTPNLLTVQLNTAGVMGMVTSLSRTPSLRFGVIQLGTAPPMASI